MKFNLNYCYNEKHNSKKIDKIVEQLMGEDVTPAPFDFLFRYNSRNYPKTTHEVLELPGKFKQIEDTAVFVIGNGVLQMDYAESITPDGMVGRDAVNNVEHQRGKLTADKKEAIFNYVLYTSIKHKKPCYPIVVTDYDYGVESMTYHIEGLPLTVYFRIFNEKRVYELLNTLNGKDYNQVRMSNEDYINFVHCIIFAKNPYAKDVIEKMVHLFVSIDGMSYSHQLDLHLALKMMIKYHFDGDDDKVKELLTMITKAVHESRTDEISGYEVERKSFEELKAENAKLKLEKEQQSLELSRKDSEISRKDSEISRKDSVISKQKKEIEGLEYLLSVNNIVVK